MKAPTANRREVLAGAGAFVLGFWLPPRAAQAQTAPAPGAAWYTEPAVPRSTRWIVVEPDDTVVIRIAQTELGQGVWTSNAMMVCEELQCDWSKVRPIYASANRDAREMAPAVDARSARQRRDGSERRRRADVRQPCARRAASAFPIACIGACARTRRRP